MITTMTRAERKAGNKAAHAMRRVATDTDYRQAKQAGESITWREVWDTYASMSNAAVMVELAPAVVTVTAVAKVRRSRKAPAHIAAMSAEYRLVKAAWDQGLEAAMCGGRIGGKPARGEKYTDEERDYRAAHPAPVWAEWLKDMSARSLSNDVAA